MLKPWRRSINALSRKNVPFPGWILDGYQDGIINSFIEFDAVVNLLSL
jgi:hypothetical protein